MGFHINLGFQVYTLFSLLLSQGSITGPTVYILMFDACAQVARFQTDICKSYNIEIIPHSQSCVWEIDQTVFEILCFKVCKVVVVINIGSGKLDSCSPNIHSSGLIEVLYYSAS